MNATLARQAAAAPFIAACLFAATTIAADAPPPASAFGTTPAFAHVALSPDGATIAMDRTTASGPKVVFFRPGEPQPVRVLNIVAGTSLRDLGWADADTALLEVSTTARLPWAAPEAARSYEFFRTMAVDLAGGESRILLLGDGNRDLVTGAELLTTSSRRKDTVSMVTWDFSLSKRRPSIGSRLTESRRDDGWVMTLFDVDTNTGKGRIVAQGTPFTNQWLVDPDGVPLARSDWKQETRESTILVRDGSGWRPILQGKDADPLRLAGLSADGKAVIAIGENSAARSKAWALPLDGSPASVAFEDATADVASAVVDHESGVVEGYWLAGAESRLEYVNPRRAALRSALEKAFPERIVYIVGSSTDEQRLLVMTESASRPPVYYLVDRKARKADVVGETYPALESVPLGTVRDISYPARDGTPIPAFLTIPPGKGDKDLPLVVLVHGGPEWHDSGGFDWWAQFLATRGYAVLQPQFRGSTGYGTVHRLAGYRQWGGLMQDDVTDGVRHLVATGVVDPKRVCIMGASYGGYAALAGAAFTPDLYSCAVSVNGVSDLPQMIGDVQTRGGKDSDALAYWKEHIGSPLDPKVAQASPARSAATVRAPILLMHGSEDTVVPAKQSQAMAKALDADGKRYEYVTLPGEDHWLSDGVTRTLVLEKIEAFLSRYL